MASRIPLVINAGQIEQLQAGDTLAAALTGLSAAVIPGGRLTLASGDPLPSSDQTAKTTVYYTPYLNSFISLYSSGTWTINTFTEKSVAVPSTTSTPFDVFGYLSAGDLALETVNWTNGTTRATALSRQDGFWTKSGDATRLYLGTGRTTTSSQNCEDSVTKRFLWNMYNRRERLLSKAMSGNGYTYSTLAFRAVNNDTTNIVEFLVGLGSDALLDVTFLILDSDASASANAASGIGINSTTATSAKIQTTAVSVNPNNMMLQSRLQYLPSLGYSYLCALERGAGTGTQTWFNGSDRGLFGALQA